MKLPISWLRDYVSVDDHPERIAERLTFAGFEVEAIETFGAGLDAVVAAEIRSVEPHPKADRLTICRVTDGTTERTVVCGAPNVRVGDKAALAGEGVRLPNGTILRATRLRGVLSEGMLCAEDELGLSQDHSGILVLPPGTVPGTPLSAILGAPETVLTIDITPNRGDGLSILGMAREVAALYRLPLVKPEPQPVEADVPVTDRVAVDVQAWDGCPRYTARVINGCRVGPSPQWMQRRLALCGVRPINNIVDVTNYVMLECGQPLHAFDRTRLRDARLVVRRAREGEALAMLDETSRRLEPAMLVIADSQDAVAVAGVMGGEASGIADDTSEVVLESAFFTPSDIRQTARRLGVSTEASYRFERGVDPELSEWASRRAAVMMAELCGGQCAAGVIDAAAPRPPAEPVRLRYDRVRATLGCPIDNRQIDDILTALQFQIAPSAAGDDRADTLVTPPSYRMDVTIEADLIEEVARLHGLDRIPTPDPFARLVTGADDRPIREAMACRDRLVALGLTEIMNYSFVSHKFLDRFQADDPDARVVIPYPVSADHAVLRPSLIPQMIETLGRNHARQVPEAALFECGRVFRRQPASETTPFAEEERLAIGLMGPVGRPPMDKQRPVSDQEAFLWLKGILEHWVRMQIGPNAAAETAAAAAPMLEWQPMAQPVFEPGQAWSLAIDGKPVGAIGILAGRLAGEWRFNTPVAVLEVALAPLIEPRGKARRLMPAPSFPAVRRDVALVVSQEVTHRQVMQVISKNAPPPLTAVALFDIFSGKGIGPGMKSLAYALIYRADDRTLTDEEVNRMHESIRSALKNELRATIRE